MRVLWDPPKSSKGNAFIEAYEALNTVLKAYGYKPKDGETWGYSPRQITGGSNWSLHAYGPGSKFKFWNWRGPSSSLSVTTAVAVDINSRANPYGKRLVTDMPRAMVEAIERIRCNGGARVWRWGGDWNDDNKQNDSNYDAMHFELQASPDELRRGINWATVEGKPVAAEPVPAPAVEEEEVAVAFKYGEDLDVFYVKPNGALVTKYYQPASGWRELELASGAAIGGEVSVVKDYLGERGRLDVFVEAASGPGLVHAWFTGKAWHSEVL